MKSLRRIALALLMAFCSGTFSFAAAEETIAPVQLPEDKVGWIAYWDAEGGLKDGATFAYKNVVLFAADFDKKNKLVFPGEYTKHFLQQIAERQYQQCYLSFVNDKQDGKKLLTKDTALLQAILQDAKSRKKHISEIIKLTKKRKCTGIEIDYENIWQDEKLMTLFAAFVAELQEVAVQEKLPLRVVLEPKTLPSAEKFPAGPEYVVMLYNLHGRHNGPGPKADVNFIRTTLQKMEALPGAKSVALATGGFRWVDGDGRAKGAANLTQVQAERLARQHKAQTVRDPHSGVLHFSYVAEGKQYQVWYADKETIEIWYAVARQAGAEKVSLWRLGGNGE